MKVAELSFDRTQEAMFNPALETKITSLDWTINSNLVRFSTSDFRRFYAIKKENETW